MQSLVLQTGSLLAVGASLYAMKVLKRPGATSPLRHAYPALVARYPGTLPDLARLEALQDETRLRHVLEMWDEVARLDASPSLSSQGKIARLNGCIGRALQQMCASAPAHASEEMYRVVQTCREDTVPTLCRHLDAILYNHLQSHRGRG